MKLALAQIHVEPGAPDSNLERADRAVAEAARSGADLVLLPEALDFGWTHPSARAGAGPLPDGAAAARLREAARRHRVGIIAGLVERSGDGRLFNAAVVVDAEGRLLHRHRKIHELDFARELYATGDSVEPVETPWGRIGVVVCADAFAPGFPHTRALGRAGVRWILSPCAWAVPPDRDLVREPYGQLWRDSYGPVCREHGIVIAGCSNVGPVTAGEWAGWRCIGGSLVVGPDGKEILQLPVGDAAEALGLVDLGAVRRAGNGTA